MYTHCSYTHTVRVHTLFSLYVLHSRIAVFMAQWLGACLNHRRSKIRFSLPWGMQTDRLPATSADAWYDRAVAGRAGLGSADCDPVTGQVGSAPCVSQVQWSRQVRSSHTIAAMLSRPVPETLSVAAMLSRPVPETLSVAGMLSRPIPETLLLGCWADPFLRHCLLLGCCTDPFLRHCCWDVEQTSSWDTVAGMLSRLIPETLSVAGMLSRPIPETLLLGCWADQFLRHCLLLGCWADLFLRHCLLLGCWADPFLRHYLLLGFWADPFLRHFVAGILSRSVP